MTLRNNTSGKVLLSPLFTEGKFKIREVRNCSRSHIGQKRSSRGPHLLWGGLPFLAALEPRPHRQAARLRPLSEMEALFPAWDGPLQKTGRGGSPTRPTCLLGRKRSSPARSPVSRLPRGRFPVLMALAGTAPASSRCINQMRRKDQSAGSRAGLKPRRDFPPTAWESSVRH